MCVCVWGGGDIIHFSIFLPYMDKYPKWSKRFSFPSIFTFKSNRHSYENHNVSVNSGIHQPTDLINCLLPAVPDGFVLYR